MRTWAWLLIVAVAAILTAIATLVMTENQNRSDLETYVEQCIERGGTWTTRPDGVGGCQVRPASSPPPSADAEDASELDAKGWGRARFVIDPSDPPDLQSSLITVQATEINCAGGQAPADRQVRGAVLEEDESRVSIVILVEPVKGAATCQGNPAFPFAVQLGAPLGDRQVFDASADPPEQRWPERPDAASLPTPSSSPDAGA